MLTDFSIINHNFDSICMSPLMIMKYLKMNYIFSVPHYLACSLVLGPNILVLCFILHVLSKQEEKKKGNSGHTVQSRFDRQKELKKWLRNESVRAA